MVSKYELIMELADAIAKRIAGNKEEWTNYLKTAARLYRYPFLLMTVIKSKTRMVREGYKCTIEQTTDWNNTENAKIWRKDLADTINPTNEQLGIAVHWEHCSFKEQGDRQRADNPYRGSCQKNLSAQGR